MTPENQAQLDAQKTATGYVNAIRILVGLIEELPLTPAARKVIDAEWRGEKVELLQEKPQWPEGVPAWAEWVAMDEDGAWYWFTAQPIRDGVDWVRDDGPGGLTGQVPKSHAPQWTGDWRDSLIERPKEEVCKCAVPYCVNRPHPTMGGFCFTHKPDAIAPGWNPDKLTNAQVGASEGWRLLDEDEIDIRFDGQKRYTCRAWQANHECWSDLEYCGASNAVTYSTQHSREQLAQRRAE